MNPSIPVRIDLGEVGWKHPGIEWILFGSTGSLERECERQNLDFKLGVHVDTRPTVAAVLKQLKDEQVTWDEYLDVSCYNGMNTWPENFRWIAVYVVTGGSEGLYLHIDAITEKDGKDCRNLLIVGKTLDSTHDHWQECWESAGRIAWRLGA